MSSRIVAALVCALALMGAIATDAAAQRRFDRDWVLLGEKEVGFGVDRDAIRIGQGEDFYRNRAFSKLHFAAERNDVHMISLRIVYFNEFAEDIRVDQVIRQGDYLPIDLRGDRAFIRRIEMTYRSRPNFRGEAILKVYGELGRRWRPEPGPGFGPGAGRGDRDWEELGCKDVALFGKDSDSIRVGRREGRFKAIRLHVRGADVEMLNLRVVYSNGEPDNLDVRHFIRQGERTRPIDLRGWERSIERIDMRYRTVPNFKGLAQVCVEGLQ